MIDLKKIIEENREYFEEEKVELPNDVALNKTEVILEEIKSEYIEPYKVTPTMEEGFALKFKKGENYMIMEIYNDGEMGYIIANDKERKLIENKYIKTLLDAKGAIVKFINNF